jgi:glycosyltransferase involved in cell wall biosynthesis
MSQDPIVDVCLLAEGNYPFVVGGVSQWIEMLVTRMPDITFGLFAITAPGTPQTVKYEMPPNMPVFKQVGIAQKRFITHQGTPPSQRAWEVLRNFHKGLQAGDYEPFRELVRLIRGLDGEVLNPAEMFQDYESFEVFMRLAVEMERFSPLIDTFYTWRSTHMPLLHVLQGEIPKARCYHAVSTGYAGLVGAMGKILNDVPLLLTEHGIYTKEREMEVMRADWINDSQRGFWMRYFNGLAKICYHFSDVIIALFETNQKLQILSGAPEERTRVIPNGVDLSAYLKLQRETSSEVFRVGTVARVTPIKDVKTFIKACCLVGREREDVEFHILGPEDESEGYAEQCHFLARDLGIDLRLHFEGRVDVKEWYPKLDVVVLSSVKEAQPLVLIEAMAAGAVCVATRVGSVPEILHGLGELVQPKRPTAMAEAILRLLDDKEKRDRWGLKGRRRVQQIYDLDSVVQEYVDLYMESSGRA